MQDDAIRQPQGIDGVVGLIFKMKRILMKMCRSTLSENAPENRVWTSDKYTYA